MNQNSYLIANGINLDLLGQREAKHYGSFNLQDLEIHLTAFAAKVAPAYNLAVPHLDFFQSNNEQIFVEKCSEPYSGLIINAGAWTHTSLALADRLRAIATPYIEVHISNVFSRESFRHQSYMAAAADGVVSGLGMNSYCAALFALLLS